MCIRDSVNTDDAVYVGKKGASESLKDLRRENPALQSYFDMGQVIYKPWGTYEILSAARQYVVRKVVLTQWRTIYACLLYTSIPAELGGGIALELNIQRGGNLTYSYGRGNGVPIAVYELSLIHI